MILHISKTNYKTIVLNKMNEEKIVAVFTSKDCDFDLDYPLYNIQNFDYKLNIHLPIHVLEILKDKAEKYNLDIEYVFNCVFYEYYLNHGVSYGDN